MNFFNTGLQKDFNKIKITVLLFINKETVKINTLKEDTEEDIIIHDLFQTQPIKLKTPNDLNHNSPSSDDDYDDYVIVKKVRISFAEIMAPHPIIGIDEIEQLLGMPDSHRAIERLLRQKLLISQSYDELSRLNRISELNLSLIEVKKHQNYYSGDIKGFYNLISRLNQKTAQSSTYLAALCFDYDDIWNSRQIPKLRVFEAFTKQSDLLWHCQERLFTLEARSRQAWGKYRTSFDEQAYRELKQIIKLDTGIEQLLKAPFTRSQGRQYLLDELAVEWDKANSIALPNLDMKDINPPTQLASIGPKDSILSQSIG